MKKLIDYIKFSLTLSFLFCASNVFTQDLHFSQYFNAPLLVNPANTGFIPDGAYRIGVNYRNQWANIGNPYKTFSAFGDIQLFADRMENGWVGIGGSLLSDVAGTGNLTSTKAYASVAYHQTVGLGSLISAGFNVGWVNKKIDFTKLIFDSQWNGKFFDISVPNGEAFVTNQTNYFTLQFGVNYAYYPNENTYLNIGFSASNINRPKETFFNQSLNDTRVPARFTTFLNGSFKLGDRWIINPNVYISKMTTAWELVVGGIAQRNLSGDGNLQLLLGGYMRQNDALIPVIGINQNGYKFTFSYDITSSGLKNYNQGRGAYEFSIIKQGLFSRSQDIKCPGVRF